jgi:hypothetical protein
VARRVHQHVAAALGAEADIADVDGDALVALGLERVGHEGPFEGHVAPTADGLDLGQLALGQGAGLMQKPADQRGLAMIDMAHDGDMERVDGIAVGHGRHH